MKKSIFALAALVALAACNKSLIEYSPVEDFGYINLGVDANTEMVVTKAETPIYNNYYVTLTGTSTNWTKVYNEIQPSDWKVPAGEYTVTVANYETEDAAFAANESKGDMYITGTNTVTVSAGAETDCPVDCTIQNSKVSFSSDAKFRDVFSSASVVVAEKEGSRSQNAVVGETHLDENTIYFKPTTLTWTLTAESKLNGTRVYTGEITTVITKWTTVTFSTGNTTGQINVTISVDNTMKQVTLSPIEVDPFQGTAKE